MAILEVRIKDNKSSGLVHKLYMAELSNFIPSPNHMPNPIQKISFDRSKNPHISFDIFPLELLLQKKDIGHDPTDVHRVDFYVVLIITEGNGWHTIDFEDYELQRGSVLSIRKDQVHNFHRSNVKGWIVLFTEEFAVSDLDNLSAAR